MEKSTTQAITLNMIKKRSSGIPEFLPKNVAGKSIIFVTKLSIRCL